MPTTPNLGLYKPVRGEVGWDDEINANFDVLDITAATAENVLAHGAVGDGVADDTAAIQAAIDAAVGGPMSGTVPTPTRSGHAGTGAVYLPAGFYRITAPLVIRGIQGLTFRGAGTRATYIRVDGTMTQAIQLLGVSHCRIGGFLIDGAGGYAGTGHVTYGISWDWDSSLTSLSSSRCVFEDIWIADLDHKYGFSVGDLSTSFDVSHGLFRHVNVSGNFTIGSAEANKWQAGFLIGSGVSGNILNHHLEDCTLISLKRGVEIDRCASVSISKTGMTSCETVVHKNGPGQLSLADIRTEESRQLVTSLGGASFTSNLSLRDIEWTNAVDHVTPVNGRIVEWKYAGHVTVDNMTIRGATSPLMHFYSATTTGRPVYWTVRGATVMFLTTLGSLLETDGGTPAMLDASGVIGTDSAGSIQTKFKPQVVGIFTDPAALSNVFQNVEIKGPSPWVDVKAYGALGDGSTDDTTAIQSAIDAAEAAGAEVFFPPGVYNHTGLTLTPKASLRGPHLSLSEYATKTGAILHYTASTGTALTITDDGSHVAPRIEKLGFTGTSSANNTTGVFFNGASAFMRLGGMTDCTVKGFGTGVLVNRCYSMRFNDLYADANATGLKFENGSNANYVRGGGYRENTTGININASSANHLDSIFESNTGSGVLVDGAASNSNVISGYFENNGRGIYVNPGSAANRSYFGIIRDCYFVTHSTAQVEIDESWRWEIYGSTFTGTTAVVFGAGTKAIIFRDQSQLVATFTDNGFLNVHEYIDTTTTGAFIQAHATADAGFKTSGWIELAEMTGGTAPPANGGRLYLKDNGAGKTQLVVEFATGGAQVIVTQP